MLSSSAKPGYDYVLIGRTATLTRPFQSLLYDLQQAVDRLNNPNFGGKTAGNNRRNTRNSECREKQ